MNELRGDIILDVVLEGDINEVVLDGNIDNLTLVGDIRNNSIEFMSYPDAESEVF